MTFQELCDHLQSFGCTMDHLEENLYMATNCINAEMCQIENLDHYSDVTLSHYFYELKIPAPLSLRDSLTAYRDFRDTVIKIIAEK